MMGSRTLLAFMLCAALHGACEKNAKEEVCGPDPHSVDAIFSLTRGTEQVLWANFRSWSDNRCGEVGGPTSLTVEARGIDGAPGILQLCLPRPDKIAGKAIDVQDSTLLQIIDVSARLAGLICSASLDRSRSASGSIGFHGLCDDGLAAEGYSVELAMTLPILIDCVGEISEEDELRFDGEIFVVAEQL